MTQKDDKNTIMDESIPQENEIPSQDISEEEISNIPEENVSSDEEKQDDIKISRLQDTLTRTLADFDNFKKRTERDKADMIDFLKADILKKILPRVDDLERMIAGTPENLRVGALYEGILALQKSLLKDLEKFGVQSFISKGNTVNPELHEVMTQVPGEQGIIIDEFEKGYMLGEKVLRVAKVVVGNGN